MRNRTYNGIPGYFVLTPLEVPGGDVVIVNRGFVPLETSGTKPKVPAAPSGVVAVNGRVRSTQKRGLFGPRDPVEGTLTEVARADLARLQQQMPYHLLPVYIELETSDPSEARGITPVPLPELDDGPHLLRDPVVLLLGLGRRRLGARRAQDREGRRQHHRR